MACLLVLCLALCGCERVMSREHTAETTRRPSVTPTPALTLTEEPAELITGVTTDQPVAALVLEGFTDDSTMTQVISLIEQAGIPCVWFASGVAASEHPEALKQAAQSGITLGNYTISAEKSLEKKPLSYVLHQLERTQELIVSVSGKTPSLARLNGTVCEDGILRAVTASGLSAAVEPTLYLNHRSFTSKEDAVTYVQGMIRGSIVSIKLGQELDEREYGDVGERLDERPAIDPPPSIDEEVDIAAEAWIYDGIIDVTQWLLEALSESGYRLVSLEELQAAQKELLGPPRALKEEQLSLLDPDAYDLPVTDQPIGQPETRAGGMVDFDGVVFIGDETTAELADYVAWRRQSEPDYLGSALFLSVPGLTVEKALPASDGVLAEDTIDLGRAAREMGAKKIYLMIRFGMAKAYAQERYQENLRLLIHLLREENPQAEIIVQSILPKVEGRYGTPNNRQIFRCNLMTAKMCLTYGVSYLDVAYAMRDANGNLREQYCLDPMAQGWHLNDAGCQAWIDYLLENIP